MIANMSRHSPPIRNVLLIASLFAALPHTIFATSADPEATPPVNPAPCVTAIASGDDDKILAACGVVIDSDKAEKADRIKALIARAGVYARRDMLDRAIDDDGIALRLDPSLADIFNARGELWRRRAIGRGRCRILQPRCG